MYKRLDGGICFKNTALRQRPTLKKLNYIEDLRLLAHNLVNKSLWRDIPNFKLAHFRI